MNRVLDLIGAAAVLVSLSACAAAAGAPAADVADPAAATTAPATTVVAPAVTTAVTGNAAEPAAGAAVTLGQAHGGEVDASWDPATAIRIVLNGDSIAASGAGVTVDGSQATITAAGTYVLSGSLTGGRVIVNTEDEAAVRLVLNGVDLRDDAGAPLFVSAAKEAVIILADGSHNQLEDGASYAFAGPDEDEPNAALFSKSDLTIVGNGALNVQGHYNDGIASKDGLVIAGGATTVDAADDGIRGKDYVVVRNAVLAVTARGDGVKADNEEDADLGYVQVDSGSVQVTAGGDAVTAQSTVLVNDGDLTLTSGGGHTAWIDETLSAKGIKGVGSVQIQGGTFTIDSADDAIHSNGAITIDGGAFDLATADDGMHADKTLMINDGDIRISASFEGLESAVITLNGGDTHISASDDAVNVAGGNDGSGWTRGGPGGGRRERPGGLPPGQQPGMPPGAVPGGPGQDAFTYTGDYYLYIRGGYLVVEADGDGIDINGAMEMSGGTVIVHGPTENMNGALDYDAGFKLTGGLLVAAGSAGMAQGPGGGSTQNGLLLNYSTVQPAGTLVHIQDSQGNGILTFAPTKPYQSLAYSSPDLVTGTEYTVYGGGRSSGVATDGLYAGGAYTPGAEYTSFTVTDVVTTIGGRVRMR